MALSRGYYAVEQADIKSPRKPDEIFDIKGVITDIEIFEHADKPYITGVVSFLDNAGIFSELDFTGMERFFLSLKTSDAYVSVSKTFIIDRVLDATKGTDFLELVTFHITEEHAFMSGMMNVNRAYRGSSSLIISKLFEQYLSEYSLNVVGNDEHQTDSTLIVPNMTPLEAVLWIKDRTVSVDGFPFFAFSTLSDVDKITFMSLKSMIDGYVQEKDKMPYVYSSAFINNPDNLDVDNYNIMAYTSLSQHDTAKMVAKGFVGSTFNFIDTATGSNNKVEFDVMEYTRRQFNHEGLDTANVPVPVDNPYIQKNLNENNSRVISVIAPTGSYENSTGFSEMPSGYGFHVASKSLRNHLMENMITVAVPAHNFLQNPDNNKTIGRKINLVFLKSDTYTDNVAEQDPIKTGTYLIYSSRFIFKKAENATMDATVHLTCARIPESTG